MFSLSLLLSTYNAATKKLLICVFRKVMSRDQEELANTQQQPAPPCMTMRVAPFIFV